MCGAGVFLQAGAVGLIGSPRVPAGRFVQDLPPSPNKVKSADLGRINFAVDFIRVGQVRPSARV